MFCVWFVYALIQEPYTNHTETIHKPRRRQGEERENQNLFFHQSFNLSRILSSEGLCWGL